MQKILSQSGTQAPPILTATYKQQAYLLLKDAILYRRIIIGEVYSQDAICAEFGISRTPVREALLELQKEGYINFLRGKGIEVVPITNKEAEDIIEMRFIIELSGSELAAKRKTPELLAKLKLKLDEMKSFYNDAKHDAAFHYKLDRQFHIAIFEAAGNHQLTCSVEALRDQFLRFATLDAFDTREKYIQVLNEHIAIYEGIASGDPIKAREAMQNHLSCTYERIVKRSLERNQNAQ